MHNGCKCKAPCRPALDMASLISKHEKTRAVSNINQVNARGDEIDASGQVIRTAGDKVADSYASQVGSQTAQARPEHPDISPSANPNAPLSPKQLREFQFCVSGRPKALP